jgi:hypothetical protein
MNDNQKPASSCDAQTVDQTAARNRLIERICLEYPLLVFAAASRSTQAFDIKDYAFESCDHAQELLLHLLENPEKLDGLLKPGTAKESTRIYSLVKSRTRGFQSKLIRRHKRIRKEFRDGGCLDCECVTRPEEIELTKISRRRLKEIQAT